MADTGFSLNYELLRGIAQHIMNERKMPQRGHRGGNIGGQQSTVTNPRLREATKRAAIASESETSSMPSSDLPIHTVGIHWVDHFLGRNKGFKKVYVRFQERARAAASNDVELQDDPLRKPSNLLRRKNISEKNL